MSSESVNELVDKGFWEVVLGISFIKVTKIDVELNISMFLFDGDRV